jgi:hypothetical protein
MATNYEKIQEDLAACNITIWEPTPFEEVQLNLCRLTCMESEIDSIVTKVTAAANALQDIEDVATADSGIDDLKFEIIKNTSSKYAWDMSPTASGMIMFTLNTSSKFYNDYIIPAVSELLVPTTESDGAGGTQPRDEAIILRERKLILETRPVDVVETTLTALTSLKSVATAKKTQLEATYA